MSPLIGLRLRVTVDAKEYPSLCKWINDINANRATYVPNKEKEIKEQDSIYSMFGIVKDKELGEEPSSIYLAQGSDGAIHITFALSTDKDIEGLPIGVTVVDPVMGTPKEQVEA